MNLPKPWVFCLSFEFFEIKFWVLLLKFWLFCLSFEGFFFNFEFFLEFWNISHKLGEHNQFLCPFQIFFVNRSSKFAETLSFLLELLSFFLEFWVFWSLSFFQNVEKKRLYRSVLNGGFDINTVVSYQNESFSSKWELPSCSLLPP